MALYGVSYRDGYHADDDSSSSSSEEESYLKFMPTFSCNPTDFVKQMNSGFSEPLISQLASQLFHQTEDASAAFYHDSTKSSDSVNMDSGAIVQMLRRKILCACVVDGIGGYGAPAAYAAHLFADLLTTKLAKKSLESTYDGAFKLLRKVAKESFQLCGKKIVAGATIGYVTCTSNPQDSKSYKAFVAALGDVAIYHYSTGEKRARQINQIFRKRLSDGKSDVCDTGGSLTTDGKMWGKISASTIDIAHDDFMLLATDGLYDNLLECQAADILSFVLHCTAFDKQVASPAWEELPTLEELQRAIPECGIAQEPLTPERIVKRVNSYLKLVAPVGKPDDIMLLCIRPCTL